MRRIMFAGFALMFALSGCERTLTPPDSPEIASTDPRPEMEKEGRPMELHTNDIAWLVDNSPVIFVGRVVRQTTEKDERDLIITRTEFELKKNLAGKHDKKSLTLTTLGGTLEERTLRVSHMPVFKEGYEYVIFADTRRKTYDPVTSNQEGVFVLSPDQRIYTYNGISVTGIEQNQIRLGAQTLKGYFARDPSGPAAVGADPVIDGGIVSVQRMKVKELPAMPLEQFEKAIQSLVSRRK